MWRALKRTLPIERCARLLATVFGVAGFALLFLNVSFTYHYAENRPTAKQSEAGRIYSLNTHGWIVYLTKEEQRRLDISWFGFFVCGGVVICMDVLSRSKTK